jgi:hypothetical protein
MLLALQSARNKALALMLVVSTPIVVQPFEGKCLTVR